MNNKQLTAADRGAIEVLLRKDYKPSEIAEAIGFDKSTVGREINRRSTPRGYIAWVAQLDYEKRRSRSKKKRKLDSSKTQKYVVAKL